MLLLLTPKNHWKLEVVARFRGVLEVDLEVDCRSKLSSILILVISINLCDSVRISIDLSGYVILSGFLLILGALD